MSPIIVASDLSPEAAMAVGRACMLANRLKKPLILLHVVDSQMPLMDQEKACKNARRQLELQLDGCQQSIDAGAQIMVERGRIAATILRIVGERNAQLLIMGRDHPRNLKPFVGSTLERVSRLCSAPLLLVTSEGGAYDNALLALDFSTYASEALRVAAMLLDGRELTALNVCNPPSDASKSGTGDAVIEEQRKILELLIENEKDTLDMLGIARPQTSLLVGSGEVRSRLEQTAERLQPDFIALGCHSRSGVEEALLGSLAKALLQNPPCDLLVTR